jgi:hypothetical protein
MEQGGTPKANDIAGIPAWMAGTMAWWLLTVGCKAVGQRLQPGRISETVWDAILDVLTLLFATQVALSIGQTNLASSVVGGLKNLVAAIAGGANIAGIITGLVIGLAFAALAVFQAIKFAQEDEKSSAWRPLTLYSLFILVALQNLPVVSEWMAWLTTNVTSPAANGVMAGLAYLFGIKFG